MLKVSAILAASVVVLSGTIASLLIASNRHPDGPVTGQVAWQHDIARALSDGKASHRDVLLLFTKQAQPSISPDLHLPEDIVLCRVDPPDVKAHPEDISVIVSAQHLNVLQMPQVILFDADGRPYSRSILADEGTLTTELIGKMKQSRLIRDECFLKATNAAPSARAKLLDRGLAAVGDFASLAYQSEMKEIVDLDADGTLGLKEKYLGTISAQDLDEVIQREVYPLVDQSNFKGAIAVLDRLIADVDPKAGKSTVLLAFKGQLQFSLGNRSDALHTLDLALAKCQPGSSDASEIASVREKILVAQ